MGGPGAGMLGRGVGSGSMGSSGGLGPGRTGGSPGAGGGTGVSPTPTAARTDVTAGPPESPGAP
jgi:hypothetical protein